MTENQEVKEIDLIKLFNIIGKRIKKGIMIIFKALFFFTAFGVRRLHYLAIIGFIGGLIGWLVYSYTLRYYSSNMIAQSNGISAIDMVQYINDLHKFSSNGNSQAIAGALEIEDSTAKSIKSIEAFNYIDLNKDNYPDVVDLNSEFDPTDTSKKLDPSRIFIKVEVFNNNAFSTVKTGVFKYISKNPYLIRLNELRKKELEESIKYTKIEIQKLDSLQNVDYFKNNSIYSSKSENRIMFLSENDKQMYYKDKLNLINQKQEYSKELEMATEPLTIIKDFTTLNFEENPKNGYILRFGAWLMVIGYILLLLLKYKRKIINIFAKSFEYN